MGTCSASIAPVRMRSTATAVCTRSPRCLGSSTPRDTSPTWWPARPTRCRAEATDGGDSICTTRSTAPMSMPSSRLEVATTQGSRPPLRSSSISARCSLDTEPWWARAMTGSAPSDCPLAPIRAAGTRAVGEPRARSARVRGDLVEPGGEPLREPAGVGEDDRGAVLLDQVDHALLDVRPDRPAPLGAAGGRSLGHLVDRRRERQLGHVLDGHDDLEVPLLGGRGSDHLDGTGAAEEPGDLLDGPHGRGQPDPLGGLLEELVEPLQ